MEKKLINSNKEKLKNPKKCFALETYDVLNDFLFSKYMAGEDNELQQRGLLESLGITVEGNIISVDTKIPPDIKDRKGSVLDCRLKTSCGKKINIEVQKKYTNDFKPRLAIYVSKMITSSLGKGQNYNQTKNAIVVAICDFSFLKSQLYHNTFTLSNNSLYINEELTDKIEIHIIEICLNSENCQYMKESKNI